MKTKPTQQAIKLLSESGVFPDFILCRAREPLDEVRKKKIETYANIAADCVISAPDIETIYSIPLNFEREGTGQKILTKFGLTQRKASSWKNWQRLVERITHPSRTVEVAMVGKYVEIGDFQLTDAYISVNQAIEHAGAAHGARVRISWIDPRTMVDDALSRYAGIIVPGAFGEGGAEGVIRAIQYARENDLPFLGLCYGLQLATVEFARNVAGIEDATSAEMDAHAERRVIDIQEDQEEVIEQSRYGGTMRLGAYAAVLKPDTVVLDLYTRTGRLAEDARRIERLRGQNEQAFRLGLLKDGETAVLERHRHRYEVAPRYVAELEQAGLVFSGLHHRVDGTELMEFLELSDRRFFAATQAHPEFKSRLDDPAPLFYGFVEAVLKM